MQFKTLIIASIASMAAAQTSSAGAVATGVSCAAQNILDACKATIQSQINACGSSDFICLCRTYSDLVNSCYANCPNDPLVGTAIQQKEQYCNFATVYGTTSTLGTASATSAASASASETEAAQSGFATGTSTSSGRSSSETSNSAANVQFSGSMLALVAAGFGLLL